MDSGNPTIIPKKDSHSNAIHSDKTINQNSGNEEQNMIQSSSLPPDGGFMVNYSNIIANPISLFICFFHDYKKFET